MATHHWSSCHQSATTITPWRHTKSRHSSPIEQPEGEWDEKRLQTCRQCKKTTVYRLQPNPRTSPLCASYQAAHTAGESLISPAAIVKTNKLQGESAANELTTASLCSDIWSTIRCMSINMKRQTRIMGNDCYNYNFIDVPMWLIMAYY